jgi:hypothetical protein
MNHCDKNELDEARMRIHSMLQEMTDHDECVHKRIDGLWKALLVSVVIGAFVMGGLIIHVAGDYYRFEELQSALAEVKIAMQAAHHDMFHKVQ